jgi:hypothetical protein
MFASIHVPGLPRKDSARLVECALDFSPWVEETAPDTVTLAIAGLTRLFGSPRNVAEALAQRAAELGLAANVAVAANPDAAVHGAHGFRGVVVMAEKQASLPIDLLEAPPEIAATLAMWGIRTFGDLASNRSSSKRRSRCSSRSPSFWPGCSRRCARAWIPTASPPTSCGCG